MAHTQSIFDRLRSMQTEGMPLHTLIVEACEVGNAVTEALERVTDAYGFDPSIDSSIWHDAFAAIARARPDDSNGNGSNGSNRSAA